jgi:hypothetical protein
MTSARSAKELFAEIDRLHVQASAAQRAMFGLIAELDRGELWADTGARDMAQWLGIRYGISDWKARKWIACAHALEGLPVVADAFAAGLAGIDKVVELTRIATSENEAELVEWAREVLPGRIRHRAELAERRTAQEVVDAARDRSLTYGYVDEGRLLDLHATLPAADGAVVVSALEREAEHLPEMPGEEGRLCADARLADALVALASARIASDPDPDRATVIVHARVHEGEGGFEIERGPGVAPETVERLLCTARVQAVVEAADGRVIGLGRVSREPPEWMLRQLRYRDRGCTFPGCGARRFVHAHHIAWWSAGGETSLENLTLTCSFHHRLVHEHGWSLRRRGGSVRWYRPDGTRFRAGPAPPPRRTPGDQSTPGATGPEPVSAVAARVAAWTQRQGPAADGNAEPIPHGPP